MFVYTRLARYTVLVSLENYKEYAKTEGWSDAGLAPFLQLPLIAWKQQDRKRVIKGREIPQCT